MPDSYIYIYICVFSLCRPIIEQYGLWDQVRVDHGKEWTLMLFIQEQLGHLRGNVACAPHLQITSKQVHVKGLSRHCSWINNGALFV